MQAKKRALLATAALTATWPAFAQDNGGVTSQVTLSTALDYTDTPGFSGADTDSNFELNTDVDALYSSVTRSTSVEATGGGRLSFGVDEGDIEFVDPRLGLSYQSQNRSTRLGARLSFTETNIDEDTDEDEVSEVFLGNGKRQDTGVRLNLDTGLDAPVGTRFAYSLNNTRYSDTNDPDLFDTDRSLLDAELILRPAEIYEVSFGVRLTTYDAEDAEQTERDTQRYRIGLTGDWTQTVQVSLGVSFDQSESNEAGVVTDFDGLGYDASIQAERGASVLQTSLRSQIAETGRRTTLSFGQTLTRPAAQFNWSVGGTWTENPDEFSPLVNVGYQQSVASGEVSVNLAQSVQTSSDTNDVVNSSLSASYLTNLDDLSSLQFGVSLNDTNDLSDDSEDRRSTRLNVTYRRALTGDWGMVAGYSYGESQDGDETTDENRLSLGVERVFDMRR